MHPERMPPFGESLSAAHIRLKTSVEVMRQKRMFRVTAGRSRKGITRLSGLQITSLHSRDEEEVAGYAECIEQVFESYAHIPVDENHIKQLHQVLLKYSSKDTRHRGEYKKLNNPMEAFDQNGKSAGIVFKTATPFDTPQKMTELTEWLTLEGKTRQTHPLLTIAVFIVHFLAIHPFQDGNGRLSRILTTLLLLQAGYGYVLYSSLERIIEENKEQYYLKLRRTQQTIYSDKTSSGRDHGPMDIFEKRPRLRRHAMTTARPFMQSEKFAHRGVTV